MYNIIVGELIVRQPRDDIFMSFSQRLWRSLLFIMLISALCGGLAMPMLAPARAAPQMQAATNVVISEFRTRGPGAGNDEFIELYNPIANNPIDISGWKISGSNNAGNTSVRATIPAGTVLQSGQYYLVAKSGGYSGSAPADFLYTSTGIADDGGIALTLADGTTIIDQVGMSAGSAYKEGTILTPLSGTSNQSYERRLGGASDSCQDTTNNLNDFANISPSVPQNSSFALRLCGTILPTSTPTSTPSDTPTVTNTSTPTNTGTPTSTGTATATATNTTVVSTAGVVISEFRALGTNGGNDEFIELYNRTSSPISIAGWVIRKSTGCGTNTSLIATIPSTVTLAPGKHYLIGGSSYSGSVTPDLTSQTLGIANDGGIAILNGTTIVDQVGLCNSTLYHEGTALFQLATNLANKSYDRKTSPGGICMDSNNNIVDFFLRNTSDPQNLASPVSICGNPTPMPSATLRPTPTRTLSPPPPPPLVAINEFVPRPGQDWNNDGVVNVQDEYVELINHGTIPVNLSGYSLDDEVNIGSNPYRLPALTIAPGERIVFYGSETALLLSDGGDGVRLLKPNGQLADAYNYTVVRFPDQSFCRLPDNGGLDDWNTNCFPTPGLQNALSGSFVSPPNVVDVDLLCPIADTLPLDFILAECPPFGNNIWRPAYWDDEGWYGEKNLPRSPGKWPVFVD